VLPGLHVRAQITQNRIRKKIARRLRFRDVLPFVPPSPSFFSSQIQTGYAVVHRGFGGEQPRPLFRMTITPLVALSLSIFLKVM